MSDLLESCRSDNPLTEWPYKYACVWRAVVVAIQGGAAEVVWTERNPPGITAETTKWVPVRSAGVGCLLPDRVTRPTMWLCVGDNVLITDSMVESPVADRFMIQGLDRLHHELPVPIAAWFYGGFVLDECKYDYPWFSEQTESGITTCTPINGDPIPIGTDTSPPGAENEDGTGTIITAINSSGAVVAIKEFMLPGFEQHATFHRTFKNIFLNAGYLYQISADFHMFTPGYYSLSTTLYLLCPRTYGIVESWTKSIWSSEDMGTVRGVGNTTNGSIFPDPTNLSCVLMSGDRKLTIQPIFNDDGTLKEWEDSEEFITITTPATTSVTAYRNNYVEDHNCPNTGYCANYHDEDYLQVVTKRQDLRTEWVGTVTYKDSPHLVERSYKYDHRNQSEDITTTHRYFQCQEGTATTCYYGSYTADYIYREIDSNMLMDWDMSFKMDGHEVGRLRYYISRITHYHSNDTGTASTISCNVIFSGFAVMALSQPSGILLALEWSCNQDWDSSAEKSLSVDLRIVLRDRADYVVLEEWTLDLPGTHAAPGETSPSNLGGLDLGALATFMYEGEGYYSDSATDQEGDYDYNSGYYRNDRVHPILPPMPVMLYHYYGAYWSQPNGELLAEHLNAKIGDPAYPSRFVFSDTFRDQTTGLPWLEQTNVSSPSTRSVIASVSTGLDRKQIKASYWFDGERKTRYFAGVNEFDPDVLRRS